MVTICLNCNKEHNKPKFCFRSCSASYNNTKRGRNWDKKHYVGSRGFISKQFIGGPYTKIYPGECSNCQRKFFRPTMKKLTVCSDECFITIKRKNAVGIKRHLYKNIVFDSNWEVDLAKFLDKKKIQWIRPVISISWIDNAGKERRYFPDFYLPQFNIFLDPKNPYLVQIHKEKMKIIASKINLLYGDLSEIMEALTGLEPACVQLAFSTFEA